MAKRRLHHALKVNMVDVLSADVFMHVDAQDTREWGNHARATSEEFDEVVRVLKPVASKLIAYVPPPIAPSACAAESAGGAGSSVCHAHDCGTFSCGCYVAGCTHCVTTQYLPQHKHTSECLALVAAQEVARGAPYDLVVKIRPDLNVTRPVPPFDEIERVVSPRDAPPALCAQGGGAQVGEAAPLSQHPLTLDDKFGLMPRRVAAVYMNATAAFTECQSRTINAPDCGEGRMGVGGKGMMGGKGRMMKTKGRQLMEKPQKDKTAFKAMRRRALSQKGAKGFPGGGHSPYWSTPQCVLKRHLMKWIPEVRMTDCLRLDGKGPVLRLIRP